MLTVKIFSSIFPSANLFSKHLQIVVPIIVVVEIQKTNTWEKIVVVFKIALLKIKTQFIRQDKAEKWRKENENETTKYHNS